MWVRHSGGCGVWWVWRFVSFLFPLWVNILNHFSFHKVLQVLVISSNNISFVTILLKNCNSLCPHEELQLLWPLSWSFYQLTPWWQTGALASRRCTFPRRKLMWTWNSSEIEDTFCISWPSSSLLEGTYSWETERSKLVSMFVLFTWYYFTEITSHHCITYI